MTFKGRLITEFTDTDGSSNYINKTGSKVIFESTIAKKDSKPLIVEFKGFLTEMSDNFQSSWETEEVYGRMDPIGTFKNTKRSISLGWNIPAASLEEAKSNLEAMRSLTSMLYPGYSTSQVRSGGNNISKPPLIRLTYANLIKAANGKGLLGWVDGFNVQPNLEMGFFIEGQNQYPKVYTMNCILNVLHEHDLGWNNEGKWIGTNGGNFPFGGNNE